MTLYDILRATRYWQRFCCYVTNAYDQNVPIGFGTRRELLDEEQNDELFDYLMCDVDSITVILVYWRNTSQKAEHFELTHYDGDHWFLLDNTERPWIVVVAWMPLPAPPDRRPPEGEEDA